MSDRGSIERWEDLEYSSVYTKIFNGQWEQYDAFDYKHRLNAKSDLHEGMGQCSMLRMYQGFLAMSTSGPGEGSIMVNPMLKLTTAYLLLRPFFAPVTSISKASYNPNDGNVAVPWKFVAPTSVFPNTTLSDAQELNTTTHPHLQLQDTMVPIPKLTLVIILPGTAMLFIKLRMCTEAQVMRLQCTFLQVR